MLLIQVWRVVLNPQGLRVKTVHAAADKLCPWISADLKLLPSIATAL